MKIENSDGENNGKFKLTVSLVPENLWGFSLYNFYKKRKQKSKWQDLKNNLFRTEGKKCWICGNTVKHLEAHEFWSYDSNKGIQHLDGIHHICPMCHKVKHFVFWTSIENGQERLDRMGLTVEDLIDHFCEVNQCSFDDFEEHLEDSYYLWKKRSKIKWKQDLGKYNPDKITAKRSNKK